VYINQGDTLHLYGDFLHYDGNTRIAKVRNNVKLINRETTLTTEALDYNIADGIGYYTNHADIVNQENHLESIIGYYYTRQDLFDFQDSVIVVNPDYTIYSDQMKYNTETKISYFNGPTEIISDSSYIYCERGWYNTETDISQLNQNALVRNTKQTIRGDSLYYEKETGYGRAIRNVEIVDHEQDILLRGNRAIYYRDTEYARLTERAQFIQAAEADSLYLHADTLLSEVDTSGTKYVKAYYGVRIYRTNLQGKCDSMVYNTTDSIIKLYVEPVLWSDENQISANYIEIYTENRQAKTMYLYGASFIASMEDTSMFNQIKGKNMVCHFRNNQIYKIDVFGNGQTIYYPEDKDGIIGANKTVCSDLTIFLKNGKVDALSFFKKPDSVLHPLDKAPIEELILSGFMWLEELRPKNKEDIFRKVKRDPESPL
jgi:lipopolysaccharide export system protein LptA